MSPSQTPAGRDSASPSQAPVGRDSASPSQTPVREGKFIVVEGIDGSGSTTLVQTLVDQLRGQGRRVHKTCEPSSGPIGAMIRQVLAHRVVVPGPSGAVAPSWSTMALLFAADRLDHLQSEVLPQLQGGATVISDRYDLSSLAYQSATAEADAIRTLAWIRELNRHARRPDLTLVLDVRAEVAAERRQGRGGAEELYEKRELQARLCQAYAQAEMLVPGDPLVHLDANLAPGAVSRAAFAALESYLL
jgi:dTMP kinase